uniref:Uncharacterized protein n=1 Tax=Candidatus Kentrum sp. TC TaxID=2126339 RepID=A0A450Z152_9GAMM|nr:MAG: hypothetical protein BECKTC1821E_GA0114239_108510 [Candidatus Kentron sp. TC]
MPYKLIIRYTLFRYTLFAIIATATNICAQDLVIRSYNGTFDILTSVIIGTGVGLVVKYILDKPAILGQTTSLPKKVLLCLNFQFSGKKPSVGTRPIDIKLNKRAGYILRS